MLFLVLFLAYLTYTDAILFLENKHLNVNKQYKLYHFADYDCVKPNDIVFISEFVAYQSLYIDPNTNYVLIDHEQHDATINVYNDSNNILYSTSLEDPIDRKILYEFVNCYRQASCYRNNHTYYICRC